ncbi:hypothetical protein HHK36_001837 [Tetracentron sinense]|uniref:Uncharacterized protein n=1 Tax=Tetracentron sinense TaxID=13715 RepID=A0A834ZYT2_TETSI|nr:hypothetical protein HHK36_001837 [Tetracentron sinense]
MAGNSSSRRKSSSSLKKKISKNSSEARKRKRSSSRRRNKSKKLRHHDDSRNEDSVSVSSFDSEDGNVSRRARSRTRGDTKGSKKRVRRSLSSPEGDRDSSRQKKRKGSKRNGGSDAKKKTHQRKGGNVRSKRDAIVNSTSSDSQSCSTCRGGSEESEFERPRGRSEGKAKDKRRSSKTSKGTKKTIHRSRSCSSCSGRSNKSGYQSKERLTGENYLRRLRSVLTVTKRSKDNEGRDNKEEIIYDYDDYPSCRSNESNDAGRKRESAHHTHVVTEKKRRVDNVESEETFTSNFRTSDLSQSGKEDGGAQYSGKSLDGINNHLKGNTDEVSAGICSVDDNDLESLLRLKALENLKKFRGGLHTNTKTPNDKKDESGSVAKQPSTANAEPIQIESHKEDVCRGVHATQVIRNVKTVAMPTMERKSTSSTRNDGKIPDGKYSGLESMAAKLEVVHPIPGAGNFPSDQTAIAGKPTEKNNTTVGFVNNKSTPRTSTFRRQFSGAHSTPKQTPTSQESLTGKLLDTNVTETAQTIPGSSNIHGVEVKKACGAAVPEASSSYINPVSREHGSNEPQDEAKAGSRFEQKTMSVVRGGEAVQVSYKVYIPKKAPALARRQLQR